jgi:hypothetical protein
MGPTKGRIPDDQGDTGVGRRLLRVSGRRIQSCGDEQDENRREKNPSWAKKFSTLSAPHHRAGASGGPKALADFLRFGAGLCRKAHAVERA